MASPAETAAMLRAVDLAAEHLGRTSPNPVVGCVILDAAGAPVGEGAHQQAGGPHAEIHALQAAGDRARQGTAVVTLEPCAHVGRTGPCTAALIEAGIRRVVYAVDDPADGAGGAAVLRTAGLDVEGGVCTAEAAQVNEAWLHASRTGRPFVVWKLAATLDGHAKAADGTSQWITGADARGDVHRLRAQCDAIVVGVGTVLADDPQLTVRDETGRPAGRQPLRVVVDRSGRTPETARVRDTAAETLITPARTPAEVLEVLYERGVRSVFLEGGPTLASSFVRDGLVDKVVGYVAPALLSGAGSMGDIRRLRFTDVQRVGDDVRLVAYACSEGA